MAHEYRKRRRYTEEERRKIFESTDGRCHLCWQPLQFERYGQEWEIDHSRAVARGGSDYLRNLKPAHISCNRSKRDRDSRSVRRAKGAPPRAPLSKVKKAEVRKRRAIKRGIGGGLLGWLFSGPPGAAIGGLLGAASGLKDPDEEELRRRKGNGR